MPAENSKPNHSPDQAYLKNMSVISAQLSLGSAIMQNVMGDEALSNQVLGESQSAEDIQHLLAARISNEYGS